MTLCAFRGAGTPRVPEAVAEASSSIPFPVSKRPQRSRTSALRGWTCEWVTSSSSMAIVSSSRGHSEMPRSLAGSATADVDAAPAVRGHSSSKHPFRRH